MCGWVIIPTGLREDLDHFPSALTHGVYAVGGARPGINQLGGSTSVVRVCGPYDPSVAELESSECLPHRITRARSHPLPRMQVSSTNGVANSQS